MLNKKLSIPIFSILAVGMLFGGISVMNYSQTDDVRPVDSSKSYPVPPPFKIDSYGLVVDQDYFDNKVGNSIPKLDLSKQTNLELYQTRISVGGEVTMLYVLQNDNHTYSDNDTSKHLKENNGVIVHYQELILNRPVQADIDEYEKLSGNEGAGILINGNKALLISENLKLHATPKIKIYDETNMVLITLDSNMSLDELRKIANNIH